MCCIQAPTTNLDQLQWLKKIVLQKQLNRLLLLFHPLVKSNPRALKAKALSAWMKGNVSQGLNTMSRKAAQ